MNTDMVHVIPDNDLAQAVHSPTGAIPSWLALAELNRRNTLRQSAPVQAPQGTVADGVVGQALKASGIQAPQGGQGIIPSQPSQPQTQPQAPASGGIMSSVPRMAKGGIMKLAGGGPAPLLVPEDQQQDWLSSNGTTGINGQVSPELARNSIAATHDSDGYGGLVPMLKPLNPADYRTEYIAPNLTTDQQANDATKERYGPGIDFKPNLDEIAKMKGEIKPWGGKDWLKNMGASLMASKDRNVANAFGSALLGTNALEKSTNQQNLLNSEKLLDMQTGIQETQQSRQDKIADAAERYQTAKNALAESQSVQQNSNARSNNEMAANLAERNQAAQVEMDKAKRDFMTNVGNPIFAANLLNDAKRRGDDSTAGIAQDALNSDWSEKKKESDMQRDAKIAEEKVRAGTEYGLAAYRSGLELKNKKSEMFLGMGLGEDGSPMKDGSGKIVITPAAHMIATYAAAPPSSRAKEYPGLMAQVAEDRKQMGLDPYDETSWQTKAATRKNYLSGNGLAAQNVQNLNTVIEHTGLAMKVLDAMDNGSFVPGNDLYNKAAIAFGDGSGAVSYQVVQHALAEEGSKLRKGGIATQEEVERANKDIDSARSPKDLKAALRTGVNLYAGKFRSMNAEYHKGMGTSDPRVATPLISDDAGDVLQELGYDRGTMRPVGQGSSGGHSYSMNATGPNNHKIGSNDGKTWFDIQTGKQL